jgi:Na+-translocating ferredoxin:NAD+ oxidoreductase subunit B
MTQRLPQNQSASVPSEALAAAIDAALPQTQCARCGYPDCLSYARAIAQGQADINQCPPGGAEGVQRLAALTGRPTSPLNPSNGQEGPRNVAFIDETWCIGCTLCIKACPVDCIVGTSKRMHTVIESLCTGCELCIPVCPVDCIHLEPVTQSTGWAAWSSQQAQQARERYAFHQEREQQAQRDNEQRLANKAKAKLDDLAAASAIQDPVTLDKKRTIIEAALAQARARAQSQKR